MPERMVLRFGTLYRIDDTWSSNKAIERFAVKCILKERFAVKCELKNDSQQNTTIKTIDRREIRL